jgi:lipoteichoic acid synthase
LNSLRFFGRDVRAPLAEVWAIAAAACLGALSFYRAELVDLVYGTYTGCQGCFNATVWANDALLLAALLLIFGLSRLAHRRAPRLALAMVATLGIILYVTDLVVFRLLTQRLLVADVFNYARDTTGLLTVVRPLAETQEGFFLLARAVAAVLCTFAAILLGSAGRRWAGVWLIAGIAVFFAGWVYPRATYLHSSGFKNVWQVNMELQSASREYSKTFWNRGRKALPPERRCETGLENRVSVVVVVVESLSAYHSKLFLGLHDYTPSLDLLAQRGTYFTHFLANGYSTEGGLISLLAGYVPIPTVGRSGSMMSFTAVEGDFHRSLDRMGYETAFFTSWDLSLSQADLWLPAIGIAYAEGGKAPFYDGMPRGAFGAASDAALVDRFSQWFDARRSDRPFMATVLTAESHPPFNARATGRNDEAAIFREVDRQIARLANGLEARGFFRNGVLIILGDHRAMTPIPPLEVDRLGPSAPWRVFAIALGKTGLAMGEDRRSFQQLDLIPSLQHVIGGRSCRSDWQGRFLGSKPQPARYVVRADPLLRNQVVVSEGDREYRLLLDGDDTRWIVPPDDARDASLLLEEVNRQRISRMPEP